MGLVISFAQQKGGAGKTTILTHLARAWQNAGKSVGLIDLDPQRSLSQWNTLCGSDVFECQAGAAWRAMSDIRESSGAHDLTLVDCPGNASDLLETVIRESSMVLIPCQPSSLDVWASKAIVEMCAAEKTASRVILNRVPPRGTHAGDALKALNDISAEVMKSRLGSRVAFSAGMGRGLTALELPGSAKAKSEIVALQQELDRLLKKL